MHMFNVPCLFLIHINKVHPSLSLIITRARSEGGLINFWFACQAIIMEGDGRGYTNLM